MTFSVLPRFVTAILFIMLFSRCSYYHSQQTTTKYKKLDPSVAEQIKKSLSISLPEDMVVAHNTWRQKNGVTNVKWSSTLADVAQQWADTLRSKNCQLKSNPDRGNYGENLAQTLGTHFSPIQVVNVWGEEGVYYDKVTQRCQIGKSCAYYKQLIATEIQKIGCGVTSCGSVQVWVCYYN